MTTTMMIREQKRTYTTDRTYTVAGTLSAEREALRLARSMGPGWEHHAGLVVYLAQSSRIVRLDKGPDGQTFRESIVR